MPSLYSFKSSYGINIDFEPWFSNGYRLVNLKIREELGGALASGSIRLEQRGELANLKLITDQYTGLITITRSNNNEEEILFKFEVFIINRTYEKNYILLDFYCIADKSFYVDLMSLRYNNITDALNSLYPKSSSSGGNLEIDIRCESDITNEIPIIQFNETKHALCTKLASSFKKDCIFGFGFSGFFIKDILGINSFGKEEKVNELPKIIGNLGVVRENSFILPYTSILFKNIEKPWELEKYNNSLSVYNNTIQLYNNYIIVGNYISPLIENYIHNITRYSTNMYSSTNIVINNIPEFRLGDVIEFIDEKEELTNKDTIKFPLKIFLVCSNEFFITADSTKISKNLSGLSWTSKLVGLEQFGELLPKVDLTNLLTNTGSLPE